MKKKKYILLVSQTFLKGHPREGEPTLFKELILNGIKKHTIRYSIEHWQKVAQLVNSGEAVVSIRYWEGRPYHSPQKEIMQLEKIGVQFIQVTKDFNFYVDGKLLEGEEREAVMRNDGLMPCDFKSWFPMGEHHEGVIVHFTDLRY